MIFLNTNNFTMPEPKRQEDCVICGKTLAEWEKLLRELPTKELKGWIHFFECQRRETRLQ